MRLLEKLRVLEQPTVVGAEDNTGATPLHYAAADGRVEMIRMLRLYGGDMQQPDGEGNRPLHWAVLKGAETSVECLVAEGADINARGKGGRTATHHAVISKQVHMIHSLHRLRANFEHKDDVRAPLSPPRFALTCGIAVLVAWTRVCVSVLRWSSFSGSTVQLERTPLLWAVAMGEHGTLRHLIQCGAEVNAADNAGFTGLHEAAEANDPTVASILCTSSGIDKDVPDVEVSFND